MQRGKRLTIIGGVLVAVALLLSEQTVAALFGFSADTWTNLAAGKIWIIRGDGLVIGLTLALIPFRGSKFGRRLSTVFIGLASMLGIILLIEGGFLLIGVANMSARRTDLNFLAPYRYQYSQLDGTAVSTIIRQDQTLGHKFVPDLHVRTERLGVDSNVLFTATYSIDTKGHRLTPVANPGRATNSFCF
jgi:hypothetical protein